jgi:hypothetical protein
MCKNGIYPYAGILQDHIDAEAAAREPIIHKIREIFSRNYNLTSDAIKVAPQLLFFLGLALLPVFFLIRVILLLRKPTSVIQEEATFGYYQDGDPDKFISIANQKEFERRHTLRLAWATLISYVLIPPTFGLSIVVWFFFFHIYTSALKGLRDGPHSTKLDASLRMLKLEKAQAAAAQAAKAAEWSRFNDNTGLE